MDHVDPKHSILRSCPRDDHLDQRHDVDFPRTHEVHTHALVAGSSSATWHSVALILALSLSHRLRLSAGWLQQDSGPEDLVAVAVVADTARHDVNLPRIA